MSDYCRSNNSKRVSGIVFVDAENSHLVIDSTCETIESVKIGEITLDEKVRCATNNSHDFQSGDYIRFENMEGTNVKQLIKL